MSHAGQAAPATSLGRRLAWLLVFRGSVATVLLILTGAADAAHFTVRTGLLYGVVIGSYAVVLMLGLLLRSGASPLVLSAVHLAAAVFAAAIVVQGTGVVESGFSFLFVLAVLDGAIVGARGIAVAVASASSLVFGVQLALQLYGFIPTGDVLPAPEAFAASVVLHVGAFYAVALLAGFLASQWLREQRAATSARVDLEIAREVHAAVLESLPMGVLTYDSQGTIQTSNAAAKSILGTGVVESEALPESLQELIGGAEQQAFLDIELGGEPRHLSVTRASLVLPEEAEPLRVLVLEDRTQVMGLERRLRAKERLASVGELAAAISHELRNPLAAISGSIELLSSDIPKPAERQRLQSIVLREIDRLNRLVGDFLVYARPAPPDPAMADLVALLKDLCAVARQDAAWSSHELRLEVPTELYAHVDARQVRQMLWNLLGNAVHASEAEQPVDLRVRLEAETVIFEIQDHGCGVPEEIREHLFEPFRTTKSGGTGLGLAVVHRIVENHDGSIEVETELGKGTLIRIRMPMGEVGQPSEGVETPDDEPHTAGGDLRTNAR